MLHAEGSAGPEGGLYLYPYAPNPLSWMEPLALFIFGVNWMKGN